MASLFKTRESRTLAVLVAVFVLLGLLLYFVYLGQFAWNLLLLAAVVWFVLESEKDIKRFENAMKIGLFLMLFDFAFENSGWILGLWQTFSMYAMGVVPLQVMGICFFGGTAWATYMPKKYNPKFSFYNNIVFGVFGALGEWLLIRQGLFAYHLWWTSILAFLSYFLTWVILNFVRYRVFKD